jgi:hypothetical protein
MGVYLFGISSTEFLKVPSCDCGSELLKADFNLMDQQARMGHATLQCS